MKFKAVLFLCSSLFFLSCSRPFAQNVSSTHPDPGIKDLNVDSLYRLSVASIINSQPEKYLIVNQTDINYSEYDGFNYVSITGNKQFGFTRLAGTIDKTPVFEKTVYDSAGRVMFFQKMSSAFASKTNLGMILRYADQKFPIGKTYYFDKEGKLTRWRDFDKELSFKIDDVIKFCGKKNITPAVNIDGTSGNWVLFYQDHSGYNQIVLDGRSGKIISERYGFKIMSVE